MTDHPKVGPLKIVDEAEFSAFLASYPRPLERDVFRACEPPLITYNDFERAPYWPDSVVASKVHGESSGRVLADINSPVPDDGTRATDKPTLDADGVELRVGDRVRVYWGSSGYKEHLVTLNNPGTKYEHLGISGCANHINSAATWLIDRPD